MDPIRVAIVGCGTAGAAAALFLSRAGHDVTLFERVPDPKPVGAGIMMQPSGLLVLERLGCAERVLRRGAHVDALVCKTTSGRTILHLRYGDLGEGLFGIGLHRGVLFETLYEAVRSSAVRLRLGVDIIKKRGRMLIDAEDGEHGLFELVVLCDGARSHLRDRHDGLTKSVRPYPWGALWFIGEVTEPGRELRQFVRGTETMIGVLPTGAGPGDEPRTLASFFFSVHGERREALFARGLDAWRTEVRTAAPPAEELVEQIHDFDQLTFASYWDVSMPRWHDGDMVLLGDAAHAMSPQLGQGCNLALCDAEALADAVDESRDVRTALERYTLRRRDHLAFYQLATRALTPFFQSDSAFLGHTRDLLMPITSIFGIVRREMLRSMAGTKTGVFYGSRETRMPRDITCTSKDP